MGEAIVIEAGNGDDDQLSPERREAGKLPIQEFEAVLDDPSHRLHAAASEMTLELAEAMRSALVPVLEQLNDQIQPGLNAMAKAIGQSLDVRSGWKVELPAPVLHPNNSGGDAVPTLIVQDEATALEVQVPGGSTADDVRRILESKLNEVVAAVESMAESADANANRAMRHQRDRAKREDLLVGKQQDREKALDGRHIDTFRVAKSGVLASWLAAVFSLGALIVAIAGMSMQR